MPASAMAPAVPANLFSLRRNSSPFHESGLLNSEKRLGVGIAPTTNVLDQLRAALGAIAAPKLTAVYTVVCTEIELTVENRQMFRQRACSTRWVNVLDHGSATFATITAPQLKAICAVIGFVINRILEYGHVFGTPRGWTDSCDQFCTALSPVTAPQAWVISAFVRNKIERAVEDGQTSGETAIGSGTYILHQVCAIFGSITSP